MQMFIIRAVKNKSDDPFGMHANDEYVYFFCSSLKDLRATMRHINPRGYRIRSARWFSTHIKKHNNDLKLNSGWLGHERYRIIRIFQKPENYKSVDFTNREGETYRLKGFDGSTIAESLTSLFN